MRDYSCSAESFVTVRSLIGGLILAVIMAGVNSYLTLKVGIIEEGPIITMMLFVGIMRALGKMVTPQEAAMVATLGSAGGSFGFIANFFGAFSLVGHPLSWWQMVALPVATSMVGLMMAVPLRQLYVVKDPLPWPTSKAAIAAINAVTNPEGGRQTTFLFLFSAIAGLYVFLSGGLHWLPEATLIGAWGLGSWGVGVAWSPFIIGAGYLIGFRVGLGFLAGALVLLAMAPFVPTLKPHLYIWPGVMFLVASGLTVLALNWRTVAAALRSIFSITGGGVENRQLDEVMSPRRYQLLAVLVLAAVILIMLFSFKVAVHLTLAMCVFGGIIFNLIATRAAGETAFNPVRVMGVMLQGVCASLGGASTTTNLTGAGFAAASIGQTGILVQDNYFGRHFRLPARWQWFGQLAVLLPIAFVSAFVYTMISKAYPLQMEGEGGLAAPVAKMWAAMSFVFSGEGKMPFFAVEAMWIGGAAGILFALLDTFAARRLKGAAARGEKSLWRFIPHSVGLGIALIIPIYYSLAFFLGALLLCVILPKFFKTSDDTLNSLAAAGIVGEGVVGLLVAILVATGVLLAG